MEEIASKEDGALDFLNREQSLSTMDHVAMNRQGIVVFVFSSFPHASKEDFQKQY